MRPRDLAELCLLAAIWGASFLFMRIGAGQFGPTALVWVRVSGAAIVLLPILVLRGELPAMLKHWKAITVVGLTNSAFPFLMFSYAVLTITGSLASVFNAATPLFGAFIGWLWLKNGLSASRVVGLVIGFAGVLGLAWSKASFKADADSINATLSVAACLLASLSYGYSANYTRKHVTGVPPMALAAGSQIAATLALAAPAWLTWPTVAPSAGSWTAAIALAVVCTGIAYILYFRLIANAGASNALSVTFLVPAFAVLWGAIFIGERPTVAMLAGCAVIFAGTALATGLLRLPQPTAACARR